MLSVLLDDDDDTKISRNRSTKSSHAAIEPPVLSLLLLLLLSPAGCKLEISKFKSIEDDKVGKEANSGWIDDARTLFDFEVGLGTEILRVEGCRGCLTSMFSSDFGLLNCLEFARFNVDFRWTPFLSTSVLLLLLVLLLLTEETLLTDEFAKLPKLELSEVLGVLDLPVVDTT